MRWSIARLARSNWDGSESTYWQLPPVAAQNPQTGLWLSHLVFRDRHTRQALLARLRLYEGAVLESDVSLGD
jgi:hypothetical protein